MTDTVDHGRRIIVLSEDARHEKCLRAFLKARGIDPRAIHVRRSPPSIQDAKQWIRETAIPEEWGYLEKYNRTNRQSRRVLLIVSDADNATVEEQRKYLSGMCGEEVLSDPHVVFLVPRWAIETWILHLLDAPVGEDVRITNSHKGRCHNREREAARILSGHCDRGGPPNPPSSLSAACEELGRVKEFL